MSSSIKYFKHPGSVNTTSTFKLVLEFSRKNKIKHLVVASTTGKTVLQLLRMIPKDLSIICVTHHAGFTQPGMREMSSAAERRLNAIGIPVLRTTHLFAGVDRALRLKFGGISPAEIVAHTYRTLGEGFKVAVEIAVMTLDAGLIPYGKDIISIGGTGSGADTAIVIRPAHSHHFFDTKIKQIICKPV
ncbi:MAG: pyruvate kinase alpha/beta domain-containing protein [candidate division WOR-3 bacterium]